MKMSARWGMGLTVSVLALSLVGCKNSRNDAADNDHAYNQVGEVRVFDEPRKVATPKPSVNVLDSATPEFATGLRKSKFVRIGEMDMDN